MITRPRSAAFLMRPSLDNCHLLLHLHLKSVGPFHNNYTQHSMNMWVAFKPGLAVIALSRMERKQKLIEPP